VSIRKKVISIPEGRMKSLAVVVLAVLFSGCNPVPTQTVAARAAMDMATNEALAIAHLRSLVSAQATAKALNVVDTDGDGWGEFLFLDELSGARPPRAPGTGMRTPLLIDEFRHHGMGGYVEVHGYLYRLFLPRGAGEYADEGPADGALAEVHWCGYAWPLEYGRTGCRSFYVDEYGTVRAAEAPALSGSHAPRANAASGGGFDGTEVSWAPCAEEAVTTAPAPKTE
jgi:hypothetical protein